MKKGQIEIVGLLVIIILIVIGGVIYLMLSGGSNSNLDLSKQNLYSANLVQALTQYSTCQDISLETVFLNCYYGQNTCDQDSCFLIKKELNQIMPLYLESSPYKNYLFTLQFKPHFEAEYPVPYYTQGNCSKGIVYGLDRPTREGTFKFNLILCQ